MPPTALHRWLAARPRLPLLVNAWYDDLPQKALAARTYWGMVQGVSQAEHFGEWVHYFRPDGSRIEGGSRARDSSGAKAPADAPDETLSWKTLLYQPIGSVAPASNFIISDLGLCRDPDGDRHSNADPRSGPLDQAWQELSVSRMSLLDPDRTHFRAPGHEALIRPAFRRSAGCADAQRNTFSARAEHRPDRHAPRKLCRKAYRRRSGLDGICVRRRGVIWRRAFGLVARKPLRLFAWLHQSSGKAQAASPEHVGKSEPRRLGPDVFILAPKRRDRFLLARSRRRNAGARRSG